MVGVDNTAKAAVGHKRRSLADRIMDVTGNSWGGGHNPPMSNRSIYVEDEGVTRVFATLDDGGFIGIGYPDKWQTFMRTKAARMFAVWVFRQWLADWCGLRSWAYYVALHAHVKREWKLRPYKKPNKRVRRMTRKSSHDEWRKSGERS